MALFINGDEVAFLGKDPRYIGNALFDHAKKGGNGVMVTLTPEEVSEILKSGYPVGQYLFHQLCLSYSFALREVVRKTIGYQFDAETYMFQTFKKKQKKSAPKKSAQK